MITIDANLYNKELVCPVCKTKIHVTKIKGKALRVKERDTDFCVHYNGLNPILYDAWVCENCGYASQSEKFLDIAPNQIEKIKNKISPKWTKRSFNGERTDEIAIEAFKLALLNTQIMNSPASDMAKVCLRIAWIYRYKNDPEESKFLKFALDLYMKAYEEEDFPINKLDEVTCLYIIGELSRRLGLYDEALNWFSKAIYHQKSKENPKILELARDQVQLTKEEKPKD